MQLRRVYTAIIAQLNTCLPVMCADRLLCGCPYVRTLVSLLQGPVWQQLKSMCDKSPDCWRRRLQRQEAEATRMREQAQTLQQQLADRDAQLAASQAQAEKLQQRLSQFEGGGGNDQP